MFVATQCQANLSVPIFPSSIYSLCICVSRFGDFQYLKFFIIIIFLMVISDQSCYFYDSLTAQTMVSIFSNI